MSSNRDQVSFGQSSKVYEHRVFCFETFMSFSIDLYSVRTLPHCHVLVLENCHLFNGPYIIQFCSRGTCCGSKVPCRELYSRFLSFKDHISTITGPTKGHDKLLNYWKWCILYQGLFDICFDFKEIAHVRWPLQPTDLM